MTRAAERTEFDDWLTEMVAEHGQFTVLVQQGGWSASRSSSTRARSAAAAC
jgi:hypothetical protein